MFLQDQRLRKEERLRCRREFLRVQRKGNRGVTSHFVVYARIVPTQAFSRLGLTVSRKVGNAVVRNKVKRRLREIFRRNKQHFPVGYDFVMIARPGTVELSFEELHQQALKAAHKATRPRRTSHSTRPKSTGRG